MNTRALLSESLYNLGHIVDEIYKDIIFPFIAKAKSGDKEPKNSFDIAEYIKPAVKQVTSNFPFKMILFLRITEKSVPQWYENKSTGGKNSKIILSIAKIFLKKNYSGTEMKRHFVEYLTHELTHAIDKLRMGKVQFNSVYTGYGYIKDVAESNAFIHQLLARAKVNKKNWNSIKSFSGLGEFLMNIDSFGGIFSDLAKDNPNAFKTTLKKIAKRLARENALPKGMLTSF